MKTLNAKKPAVGRSALSVGLGLLCILQQTVGMILELVRNIPAFARKNELEKPLTVVFTFSKYFLPPLLIVLYCFIEPAFAEPVEVIAKLNSGLFVAKKLDFEKTNGVGIKNVNGVGAIKTRPENSRKITESKMPLNLESAKNSDEGSEQPDIAIQAALLGLMAVLIPMIPVFIALNPNVK